MPETMTISIDEQLSKKFRKLAAMKYGRKKGAIGKAVAEALNIWNEDAENDVNANAIRLLEKGFFLGGLKIKDRSELHER